MYFYRSVCKKEAHNQFLGRYFGVLSFRCVINLYLIRPSTKNSNFLCEMLFLYPKHTCKKSWKNSTYRSLLWTRTWKKITILHGSDEKSK